MRVQQDTGAQLGQVWILPKLKDKRPFGQLAPRSIESVVLQQDCRHRCRARGCEGVGRDKAEIYPPNPEAIILPVLAVRMIDVTKTERCLITTPKVCGVSTCVVGGCYRRRRRVGGEK